MSESDGEQAARSLALEQAYVHEVYEQCADRTVQGKHWPRIYQFLEELEPGALVCDIGCGNGKYLNVNHNVFKIGVDRCQRFTNIAREKKNEVLTCDNLCLPFRDESFDAVLSIAVVHHFSTTERRVRAIKELARVLRIGGRLIISVWAMEQKHRKFESQDVLVPWPKAYCVSSRGSPIKVRAMSCDERHRGKNAQAYLMHSKRSSSQRKPSKNKSYWIDPIFSPSPSTSSLSSPNETCYSFFRRALQKLAGGRRSSRAWFLENWQAGMKERRSYEEEEDDDGDVDDLPIELRRLEEHSSLAALGDKQQQGRPQLQHSDSLSVKSKSLSSIVEVQRLDLVRSRSSLPGLCGGGSFDEQLVSQEQQPQPAQQQQQQQQLQRQESGRQSPAPSKPRLVKQKSHLLEDACPDDEEAEADVDGEDEEEDPTHTAKLHIPKETPTSLGLQTGLSASSSSASSARRNVHKQSSMNEELMSIGRLKERESVRKNIMKQASLNEELIYKSNDRPSSGFEAFKDSFYSGSATKRFQLLKSGLTNRIKQSTNNIEKVSAGLAFRTNFARIIQGWNKSYEGPVSSSTSNASEQSGSKCQSSQQQQQSSPASGSGGKRGEAGEQPVGCIERRLSREDGSDSSKDSSLQSDTSVDSEDSFASVIYVPKKSSSPLIEAALGPAPPVGYQLNTASAPPSPRVKYAPELAGPGGLPGHRLKLVSMSPLLKQQFPATSKSLPPPSPPGLSPRTLNSANMRPFFSGNEVAAPSPASTASLVERIAEVKRSFDAFQPLPRFGPAPAPPSTNSSSTVEPAAASSDAPGQAAVACPTSTGLAPATTHAVSSVVTSPLVATLTTPAAPAATNTKGTGEKTTSPPNRQPQHQPLSEDRPEAKRPSLQMIRAYKSMSAAMEMEAEEEPSSEDTSPLITDAIDEALERLSEKSLSSSGSGSTITTATTTTGSSEEEESRRSRLNQIKELLSQKPGFAQRSKPAFPLVRRASTSSSGRLETVSKVLPRLLSLELFNPETDDLDSDSSGVSSPESVGSVISVISDERYVSTGARKEPAPVAASVASVASSSSTKSEASSSSGEATDSSKELASCSTKPEELSSGEASQNPSTDDSDSLIDTSISSSNQSSSKLADITAFALGTTASLDTRGVNELTNNSLGKPTSLEAKTARPISLDTRISPVESTWNEECNRQLNDLTDRLSENLINDIDQYCRRTKLELDNDDESGNNLAYSRANRFTGTCKYDSGLGNKQQQEGSASKTRHLRDTDYCNLDNNKNRTDDDGVVMESHGRSLAIERSCSEESDAGSSGAGSSGFIVVTNNGEFLSERELRKQQSQLTLLQQQQLQQTTEKTPKIGQQRYGNSIESSDIGDSIENTISESSQAETRRLCSSSTASLASSSLTTDHGLGAARLRLSAQPRSASEEIPSGRSSSSFVHLQQQQHHNLQPQHLRQLAGPDGPHFQRRPHLQQLPRRSATSTSNGTLSGSSSQESLPSDQMTYHQYYHVFREGELDQLINKYVENLHIISSYYDHASWCIVAEKVQVWTI